MPWIYAILFAAAGGALGYGIGAIRSGVTLLGTIVGLAAAPTAGKLFAPIFNRTAAASPMWMYLLPPFAGFVLVFLLSMAIGFALRRPIELHFKHNEDTVTRDGFLRLDQAAGTFVGLLIGLILFFTFGRLGFGGGNIAAATATESDPSKLVTWAAGFRRSLDGTGFDRGLAALDPIPAHIYEKTDLLSLLHENPAAQARLKDYPPFMSLAEKPEFKEIMGDAEYQGLFTSKAGFSPILEHPKTRSVTDNEELRNTLLQTDLPDLRKYLETGDSPLYSDDKYKIVGRWRVDANAVIRNNARLIENLTPDQFKKFRALITVVLGKATMNVYPEGRLTVSLGAPAAAPADAAETPAAPTPSGLSPQLAARYGLTGRGVGSPAPLASRPSAPDAKMPVIDLDGEGTWGAEAGKFKVTIKTGGSDASLDAVMDEKGRLLLSIPQLKAPLVFIRTS